MLNVIHLFFQIIFLLHASPTNQILNLTEVLHPENLNLTLNESVSYYLDRSMEISSDFEIFGKNNDLNLTLTGEISNFFIIDNGIQVAFTNLNFLFDASEITPISYIFFVHNASKIAFLVPNK